jgi:hypothetical protein
MLKDIKMIGCSRKEDVWGLQLAASHSQAILHEIPSRLNSNPTSAVLYSYSDHDGDGRDIVDPTACNHGGGGC